jgi:hypothetical protein
MAKHFKSLMKPKEQLEALKKRFGTNGEYIEVTLPMTYSEVEKYFGKQCDDYEPLCGCCAAWIQWHKTNKVTVTLERRDIIKLLDTN